MSSDLPPAYGALRNAWSVLHIALLVVLALLLSVWWFHDSNGSDLVSGWWSWSSGVQQAMFHAIPFPWG